MAVVGRPEVIVTGGSTVHTVSTQDERETCLINEESKTVPESRRSQLGCPYYLQNKNTRNVF